jgi:hypothetical protein
MLPCFALDVKLELVVELAFDLSRCDEGPETQEEIVESHDVERRH